MVDGFTMPEPILEEQRRRTASSESDTEAENEVTLSFGAPPLSTSVTDAIPAFLFRS